MKPYILCHMGASIDGRIDEQALGSINKTGEYEKTGDLLEGDAWICGRTTMQQHFAEDEPFTASSPAPAGAQPVFVARKAASYAVSVDTLGKLQWESGDLNGDHLICIVSEKAPAAYLAMLREKGISYIVAGRESVDLPGAVASLGEHFGIKRLLLEGGGHINGAFLSAGLVDEVSLLVAPSIDGRTDIAAVFDGLQRSHAAVPLRLKSVEQRSHNVVWLRYDVVRSQS